MSRLSRILLTILAYVILYVATIIPRGGCFTFLGITGFPLAIFLGAIAYFIVTALFLKFSQSKKERILILVIAIAPFIPELVIRMFSFKDTLLSLPDPLFKIAAIILSWIVFRPGRSSATRIMTTILFFLLTIWFSFFGWPYWMNYAKHGTIDGREFQHINSEIIVQDSSGESRNLKSLYKHYILLDFWHKRCGVCYRVMPEIEKLYERFKDNDKVKVYSVFCRTEGDRYNTGDSIVRSRGYDFPVVSIDYEKNDSLMKKMGVVLFPQFIIMDNDNNIVFHGSIPLAEKFLDKEGL